MESRLVDNQASDIELKDKGGQPVGLTNRKVRKKIVPVFNCEWEAKPDAERMMK